MPPTYVTAAVVAALVLGGCSAQGEHATRADPPAPATASRPAPATDPPVAVRCARLLAAFAAVAAGASQLAMADDRPVDAATMRSRTDALLAVVPDALRGDALAYAHALVDYAQRLDDLRGSGATPRQLADAGAILDTDAVRRAGDHLDAQLTVSCPG